MEDTSENFVQKDGMEVHDNIQYISAILNNINNIENNEKKISETINFVIKNK
jgi:hypothetical protein